MFSGVLEAGVTRVVQSVPVLTIVAPVAASTMSVHRSLAKELVAVSANSVERRRAEALNILTFVVSPKFSLDRPLWALSGLPTLPEADVQEADLPIRLRDMDFFFLAVHEQR